MSSYQINIFISHSWNYSGDYDTLSSWIFNEKWSSGQASLNFRNYSVPRNDPIHNAKYDWQLLEAIKRQMQLANVIVIPMGMYATYSKWINKEIQEAVSWGKPILGVIPRGQERVPNIVDVNSNKVVGWSKQSVVDGIWQLYRG